MSKLPAKLKSVLILVPAMVLALSAQAASAATCKLHAVQVTGIDGGAVSDFGASACQNGSGPLALEQGLEDGSLFAGEDIDDYDWVWLGREATSGSVSSTAIVTAELDVANGTWVVDFGADVAETFVVKLQKSGWEYALFLFEDVAPGSRFEGTFSTRKAGLVNNYGHGARLVNLGAAGAGVSEFTSAAIVPVPASGLLLIGAWGGVAAWRRRRKG